MNCRFMDLEMIPSSRASVKCCDCDCNCASITGTSSNSWLRSVKRKYDEFEDIIEPENSSIARVEFENECGALREMVVSQQQSIQDLYTELEEERNAASTAANETMTMILRLQREKAETQMEARQFKRFAEEKMEHDQNELSALEDLLYKREQIIHSLTCEMQAYKHRMLSFGISEAEFEPQDEIPSFDYPPLRCNLNDTQNALVGDDGDDDHNDIEKYAFDDDHQFDGSKNVLEKVIVGHSPKPSRHTRKYSNGSDLNTGSFNLGASFKKTEYVSQPAEDDTSDRVYTIDSVHNGSSGIKNDENNLWTPRGPLNNGDVADPDIRKLQMRLQALEADRESMRQEMFSMRTDKAQMVLLKEIAQEFCKERSITTKKPSLFGSLAFFSIFKWVMSFIFWRRKARRSKYLFGLSANSVGLLMLLDKGPRTRHWKCLTRTQL